jgi:hypothetical protein
MSDIVLRKVEGLGFLPILRDEDGEELFRGEFYQSAEAALEACQARLAVLASQQ